MSPVLLIDRQEMQVGTKCLVDFMAPCCISRGSTHVARRVSVHHGCTGNGAFVKADVSTQAMAQNIMAYILSPLHLVSCQLLLCTGSSSPHGVVRQLEWQRQRGRVDLVISMESMASRRLLSKRLSCRASQTQPPYNRGGRCRQCTQQFTQPWKPVRFA